MHQDISANENSHPQKINHKAEENYKITFQTEFNIIQHSFEVKKKIN